MHKFVPKDRLKRQHRPEQMPFFVLHPESMAGGAIRWIPTNGQYPHEVIAGPDCDCRNPVCGHKASEHRGQRGACVVPGCPCGPGGWV